MPGTTDEDLAAACGTAFAAGDTKGAVQQLQAVLQQWDNGEPAPAPLWRRAQEQAAAAAAVVVAVARCVCASVERTHGRARSRRRSARRARACALSSPPPLAKRYRARDVAVHAAAGQPRARKSTPRRGNALTG